MSLLIIFWRNLIDTNMNDKEMTGKNQCDSKICSTTRRRTRHALETVAEISNEISGECTERLVQSRGSTSLRQSSPFMVEKIEFDLGESAEDSRVDSLVKEGFKLPPSFMKIKMPKKREQKYSIIEKSLVDTETETKFPAQSYRTPMKPEKRDSFLSPKDSSSGKNGFFSMRKKLGSRHEALELSAGTHTGIQGPSSASSKIKIVNNIFQNTFLQNPSKPDTSNTSKRKIKDIKLDDKSRGAIRRKGSCSLDIKDTGKSTKRVSTLLSPQHNQSKTISFHLSQMKVTPSINSKASLSKVKRSSILEDSVTSARLGEHEKKLRSMLKFHDKLSSLINEVQGTEDDVDLKDAWRFVKDVVRGYAEASQKIKQLEAILNTK
jgi:hypothetical protein